MSEITEQFECLFDAVLVKEVNKDEETTTNGIIVPDMGQEKPLYAEIIAVGPGKFTFSGVLIPTQVKVGQFVILPSIGFTKLPFEDEEYLVGPENNIHCIYRPKK